MNRFILPFIVGLLASPLAAQYGTGSITGTLDLEDARWVVASEGGGPTSTFAESGTDTDIRLVGTPDPASDGGPGTLIIEIAAATGAIETRAVDVRIELLREDGLLIAESENIDLTIEAYQQSGDDLALAGSFVATLTPGPQTELIVDPDVGITLDGNFQATIRGGTGSDL